MLNPNSDTILLAKINEELKQPYKEEEEHWKQRSRQLWLTLGDKNTGFFHASTKGRQAANKFSVIKNDEGTTFYEESQILAVISEYYLKIFATKPGERRSVVDAARHPCISDETNKKLTKMPTVKEIKVACFSIHADKAPGPDGFSASFFQTNWQTISNQIILEVQQFFTSGNLPRNINATHVRLIPKVSCPKSMKDYRPIALCSDNVLL